MESSFTNLHFCNSHLLKSNGANNEEAGNYVAVEDPGFPRGGAPTPQGAPTYDFAKISRKLHEIERIWTPGGGGGGHASLVPP